MNSNSTNINFGPAVAFTGVPTPSGSRDAELREAQWTIRKLTADLNESRSQHALKSAEVTIAKTAQAKAEKETAVARKIFLASHTMDDYERAVQLQQEIEALQRSNKDTREQLSLSGNRVQNLLAEVVSKDDQISALAAEATSVKASLSETKQALADQKTATEEIDSHLNKAYADLRQQESANRELSKAKDEAEAHAKEKELELHDLRAQWEASQDTIAELKSQQTALADLERETTSLNDEVANLRGQVSDRDRLFQVKDARIQHLEAQYQKALEGKLNAEAAASAAAAPTDAPDIFTSGDESLADELAATSDYGDDASSFEQLDFSDVTEIANIAPVARQTAMSSTQTHVSEKNATATQTDAPKLDYAMVCSTVADISPIEPTKASHKAMSTQTDDVVILAERKSQTAAAQTDISNPPLRKTSEVENSNVATQTTPIAEKTPEPTVVHVTPARKKGGLTSWWILSALCIFLCIYFYAQLQAFKSANGYGYGSRRRYSTGAFGNGRYLFGIIPIGFDIGHDWFSEQVCRQTSTAIAAFEDWAGITPTPLY